MRAKLQLQVGNLMDLSKLPKLSDTKSQAADPQAMPVDPLPLATARYPVEYRPANFGADIWISLVIGIILAFLGGTFARYAIATLTHQPFHTGVNWTDGPKAGSEVAYFELEGFTAWSDMGIFLFGLTLLFEAAAKTLLLLRPGKFSRLVLMGAVGLTFLAVILNIIACAKMFGVGITPLLSGLAVAFGGWILFDEWATLQRTKIPVVE